MPDFTSPIIPDPILNDRHATGQHAAQRLAAQADFVRRLGRRGATGGEQAANQAEAIWTAALTRGAPVAEALAAAEVPLLPYAALANSYEVHCVGHAHLDMNWQWGLHETVAAGAASFTTLLRLMDEFPELTFIQSQAALYELMRVHHPVLFERIRQAVVGGRWEVIAGQWVEAERNIIGGEGFIRQAVLGRAWCHEHLGLSPEAVAVDWVPDCFGHAASLPGLLAQSGFRHTYACRTGNPDHPAAFRWRGSDGQEVVLWRELTWYNGEGCRDAPRHLLAIEDLIGQRSWLDVIGIGDHGGGPTRRHLRKVADFNTWPVWPRWRWSKLATFLGGLDAVTDRLPVISGELNTEYSGCLTSQAMIKRGNRRGEAACAEAETAAVLAERIVGHPVRPEPLRDAWRRVCFGHFHDILPGSGVRATREHHAASLQEVLAATTAVTSNALQAIAARIDTAWVGNAPSDAHCVPALVAAASGGTGFQVGTVAGASQLESWPMAAVWFNAVALPRHEVAVLRVWEGEMVLSQNRPLRLRQQDGTLLPTQHVGEGLYWGHRYLDLAVPIEVGALGWQTLAVERGPAPAPAQPARASIADEGGRGHPPWVNRPTGLVTLENGTLVVGFDRRTGMPASIRRGGQELLRAPLSVLIVDERPYPMSSWIVGDPMAERLPLCSGLSVSHSGPVRAVIRSELRWGDTTATAIWTLDAGSDRLHLKIETRWLERGTATTGTPRLVLRLPTVLTDAVLTHEIPHGALTRHEEPGRAMPTQRWARADGADGSLVVANDGVHAYAIDHGMIAIDLLRASSDPDPLPEIGDHAWEFTIRPTSSTSDAEATRDGLVLNHPLRALFDRAHSGDLPANSGDLLTATDPEVLVAALKPGESSGSVLRLVNYGNQAHPATVRAHPLLRIAKSQACDLIERTINGTGAVGHHGVASLHFQP